jgi:REase_DpnII-MboI
MSDRKKGQGRTREGAARMDFLLKAEQCVIEATMTRPDLKDREIGDELLKDIARYKHHPDCKALFCLIYDPTHLIANPRGLQRDLERSSDEMSLNIVIVPECWVPCDYARNPGTLG